MVVSVLSLPPLSLPLSLLSQAHQHLSLWKFGCSCEGASGTHSEVYLQGRAGAPSSPLPPPLLTSVLHQRKGWHRTKEPSGEVEAFPK